MKNHRLFGSGCWLLLALGVAACGAADGVEDADGVGELSFELTSPDITSRVAEVTVQRQTPYNGEGPDNIKDNNSGTKVLFDSGPIGDHKGVWIEYRMTGPTIVTSYDLTTANDSSGFPDRDPKRWTFEGSFDGVKWVTLDTQSRTSPFAQNQTTFEFNAANSQPYLYYRLNVGDVFSGNQLQLSELRIGGSVPSGTVPAAVTGVSTDAAGTTVKVAWTAVSGADGYYVQRATQGGKSTVETQVPGGTTTSLSVNSLSPNTPYLFQVQAYKGTLRGFPSVASLVTLKGDSTLKDITALSAAVPTDQGGVAISDLTDNSTYFRHRGTSSFFQQTTVSDAVVKQYTITSANDEQKYDPKAWKLEAWNSQTSTWDKLDERSDEAFVNRMQTRHFPANSNGKAYSTYKLTITANWGGTETDVAEWRLLGSASAVESTPAAPTSLNAYVLSGDQVELTWTDNAGKQNPETSYVIERATNSNFTGPITTFTTGPGSQQFRATSLTPQQPYYFRVYAKGRDGSASAPTNTASVTTNAITPLASPMTEDLYGETVTMNLRPNPNANIAVYADQTMPNQSNADWLRPILEEAWVRAKNLYGSFGDPRLLVVHDQDGGLGGIVTAEDPRVDYRNLIFLRSDDWTSLGDGWNVSSLLHEMAHIVEFTNNGYFASPSYSAWGDSRWAPIFQYDLYQNVPSLSSSTYTSFKDTEFNAFMAGLDDRRVAWFKELMYPLYTGTLGSPTRTGPPVFDRYFELLAGYLPKFEHHYGNKNMTPGEVIHFMSAAVGVNLEATARTMFHSEPDSLLEYASARIATPELLALYPNPPEFAEDPMSKSATVNVALSGQTLSAAASDPNGDTLTYSKVSGPSWLTVASNGALTGTPTAAGTVSAVVKVSDPGGFSDVATLTFTVSGTNCTPESDAAFCSRLGASCGSMTAADNCGTSRTVSSCGSCTSPMTCGGGGTANVCGGGSGNNPCAGLCSNPTSFGPPASYHSSNLDVGAVCRETTTTLQGANCGNMAGRTFQVNGTTITCGGNFTLPAQRNGGYCFQASAGGLEYAYFTTW
jgi:hypothetical protein